uniref:DUF674 family protein n=1 Tax=Chenopodium quinoa TaxID=63459 RepID=A0A803M3M2_CHEQI
MEGQSESKNKVSLKLLIDTKANKVLFAEVGKEFVDFLFHIMSLPVGTIIKLLNVDSMVGSLGALFKSIESLSTDYFQPNLNKDSVLKPTAPVTVPLLALNGAPSLVTDKQLYHCASGYRCIYYTDGLGNSYTEGFIGGKMMVDFVKLMHRPDAFPKAWRMRFMVLIFLELALPNKKTSSA